MKQYIFLAVDRSTGRVIDCGTATEEYSWSLSDCIKKLIDRHELSRVDIIVREGVETAVPAVAEVEFEVNEPDAEAIEPDESQPF